jgi:hypothetical protein
MRPRRGRGVEDQRRLLDAGTDDPAVAGQDDIDEVPADVVDVAADGRQHHGAPFPPFDPPMCGSRKCTAIFIVRPIAARRAAASSCAKQLADRLHAVEQDVVDDVERRTFHRQIEIGAEPCRSPSTMRCARRSSSFSALPRRTLLDRAVPEQRDISP